MAPSGGVAARADTNTSSKAAMKWNEMLQNRTSGARPDKRLRTPDTLLFADELFPINCALAKNYVSRYFKINQFTPKHHFLVKSTSIFYRTFLFLFSSSDIALYMYIQFVSSSKDSGFHFHLDV